MKRHVYVALSLMVGACLLTALPVAVAQDRERDRPRGEQPRREEARRDEPRHDRPGHEEMPEMRVLRFEHIPAISYVETIEQLAESPHLEFLHELPMALNEPANAVVVVAPPPIADRLVKLAGQLDEPNPMAHRPEPPRGARRPGRMCPGGGHMGGRGRGRRQGMPEPPAPQRGRSGPRMHGWRRDMRGAPPEERQEGPLVPLAGLWALASPRAAEELGLSPEQAEAIRNLLTDAREQLTQMARRISGALEDARPEDLEELRRDLRARAETRADEVARGIRERVSRLLGPEQHLRMERWLRRHHGSRRHDTERR